MALREVLLLGREQGGRCVWGQGASAAVSWEPRATDSFLLRVGHVIVPLRALVSPTTWYPWFPRAPLSFTKGVYLGGIPCRKDVLRCKNSSYSHEWRYMNIDHANDGFNVGVLASSPLTPKVAFQCRLCFKKRHMWNLMNKIN